jgi:hypothetical protein
MKKSVFIVLCAGLLVLPPAAHAEEEKKPERWVEVVEIGEDICNLKKEIDLTPDQAGKVFQKAFPWLQAEWRDQLPSKFEPAPGAHGLPLPKDRLLKPHDPTPYATVLRFSATQVVVVVLKPEGGELWHGSYDCLACVKVARSAEIDALFGIDGMEKTYGGVHKGLKQGDTEESVVKTLGKPDAVITTQAVGYFDYFYFKDDIVITFLYNRIQKFKSGVPESVKKGDQ